MKKEIISIHFKEGQYKTYDENLKQWNHGQQLAISGLDILDEIVEVHFSLQEYGGTAKRMLGTVENGVIHVDIPAFIMEGPECCYGDYYNAWAWVYLSDEESAETVRKIELTIEARSMPDEYVTPEELTFLQQLEVAINSKIPIPSKAKPGQVVAVEKVDENGKPTKFCVVDQETGGEVDLTDYVKNNDYANANTGGVIRIYNGNEMGVAVTSSGYLYLVTPTNADIDAKKNAYKPITPANVDYAVRAALSNSKLEWLEEQKQKARNLLSALGEEHFLQLAIKPTTEKATFHNIKDSANYRVLDFGMEGKTEQPSTRGVNLWNLGDLEIAGYKKIGPISLVAGTYTFSALVDSTDTDSDYCLVQAIGAAFTFSVKHGSTSRVSASFTISSDFDNSMYIYASNNQANSANDTITFKDIQIEPGEVATDYEPYTNGPSPNPDYPQPIVNAGVYNEETGRYEHKFTVGNKNLLKLTGRNIIPEQESLQTVAREFTGNQIFIGISANNYCQKKAVDNYSIDNNSITLTTSGDSYGLGFDVPVKEGQTYIISDDNNNDNIKVGFFDSDGNWLSYLTLVGKSFTTPTGTSWMLVVFLSDTTTEVNITNIQLELDTVATEPVIHASQPFTLTSPVPLTKWDYLTKRDGVWGWSVWSLHYVFDGSENWYASSSRLGYGVECYPAAPNSFYKYNTGYCNQLVYYNATFGHQNTHADVFWGGISNQVFNVGNSSFYDDTLSDKGLANWKAHLSENPLEHITYAYEEQAFHPLPDEEQELLRNMETYYGVTNLYNDQGCPMWIQYVADPKLYVDNQLLEIKSAIV